MGSAATAAVATLFVAAAVAADPSLDERIRANHAAEAKLQAMVDAQAAAQIATLTRTIEALEAAREPPGQSVVVTASGQQAPGQRRLSESTSCCRWTTDGGCSVSEECTDLHEYLEKNVATHMFEDADSCLGSTQADWGFAFHGEDATVALSTAGSEVARVKTPLKVTHAADCAATLELQLDTTVAGDLSVSGSITDGDGTDVVAAIETLQSQMAAVASAGVVDPFSTIDTTAAGVTADNKYLGAAAVGTSVFFAPRNEDNVGMVLASMV